MSAEQTGAAAAAPAFAVQEPTGKEGRMPMEIRMEGKTERKIAPGRCSSRAENGREEEKTANQDLHFPNEGCKLFLNIQSEAAGMRHDLLTTASCFFPYFGWARFMGAGFFGVEKYSGIK